MQSAWLVAEDMNDIAGLHESKGYDGINLNKAQRFVKRLDMIVDLWTWVLLDPDILGVVQL